jgi:hypothetical protein
MFAASATGTSSNPGSASLSSSSSYATSASESPRRRPAGIEIGVGQMQPARPQRVQRLPEAFAGAREVAKILNDASTVGVSARFEELLRGRLRKARVQHRGAYFMLSHRSSPVLNCTGDGSVGFANP